MENSYESQKTAAQGKEAAIAEASPLNLLTDSAYLTKSTFYDEACILVLMESTGNSAKSIEVPARPPALTATKNVFSVN